MSTIRKLACLCVLCTSTNLVHASLPAQYEIRAVGTEQDEIRLSKDAKNVAATIEVRVKAMGTWTGSTPACEAAINFGDGSPLERATLGNGGVSSVSQIPHTYENKGRYVVTVSGTRGRNSCLGRATAEIYVLGENEELPKAGSRRASKRRAGRVGKNDQEWFDDLSLENRSPCPPGWEIIPGSDKERQYRFACRPAKVKPIVCTGGTSFYDNGDVIGCR